MTGLPPRVVYATLKPKQQEIYNFQKVASHLADFGFNCIKLSDDWQGADFLAYHPRDSHTRKVQLKGRLLIAKKYVGKTSTSRSRTTASGTSSNTTNWSRCVASTHAGSRRLRGLSVVSTTRQNRTKRCARR